MEKITNFPTIKEIQGLPYFAIVMLALRKAEIFQEYFGSDAFLMSSGNRTFLTKALSEVRQFCDGADNQDSLEIDRILLEDMTDKAEEQVKVCDAHIAGYGLGAAEAEWEITNSTFAAVHTACCETEEDAATSVVDFAKVRFSFNREIIIESIGRKLRADYALLQETSEMEGWIHTTPISPNFFALHTRFKTDQIIERVTIFDVAQSINRRIITSFQKDPKKLYSLSASAFEDFIAELFNGFGYDVEQTKRTRDGGYDIIAISNLPAKTKYLIECKRFDQTRSVGIGIVQRLLGTVVVNEATKGIIATTSHFSSPAKKIIDKSIWQLEGRDYDGIVEWLDLYQRLIIKD